MSTPTSNASGADSSAQSASVPPADTPISRTLLNGPRRSRSRRAAARYSGRRCWAQNSSKSWINRSVIDHSGGRSRSSQINA
jgi:hypothetical protein